MAIGETCLKLFVTLVILLNSASEITASCHYPQHFLREEWRLLMKSENENLEFLREPHVQNNTILYMVCNSNGITEVSCENGQFRPQLELQSCSNYMRPQLKLANNRNLCKYNLYQVGYQIQCKKETYFLETYKVCFNFDRKQALFTINEAYPFVISRPFGMQFDPDEIFTMNLFAAYNKRDIYSTFQTILGQDQRFMPQNAGDERLDRGHLTPAGDYMTNTLIATTFKMVNVIPQFHTINEGNWKQMEEWARNPANTPAKVCSGAFPWPLRLPDTKGNLKEMYLKGDQIPIPLWTYKIVLNRSGVRTAFLQYNNIHDKQVPPPIPNGICQQVSCPSNIKLTASNYYGFTYCCAPDHFMATNVPNLRGYC